MKIGTGGPRTALLRYSVYGVISVLAVALRFHTPVEAILDPDSMGHLAPALEALAGTGFDHAEARSYPYPLFLLATLWAFGSLHAVAVVQLLLGPLSGLFLFGLIEKGSPAHLTKPWKSHLHWSVGTSFVALLLLDPATVMFERTIRPEAVLMPMLIVCSVLLWKYLEYFNRPFSRKLFLILIATLLLTGLMHPRLVLASFSVSLIVLYKEIRFRAEQGRMHIAAPILSFVILSLVVLGPEAHLIDKYDPKAKAFPYRQFYYSHATIVQQAIEEGMYVFPPYDTLHLQADLAQAKDDRAEHLFHVLGYDADLLQYELSGPKVKEALDDKPKKAIILALESGRVLTGADTAAYVQSIAEDYLNYYRQWTHRLLRYYPMEVGRATVRQVVYFFFGTDLNFFQPGGTGELKQYYKPELPYLFDQMEAHYGYDRNATFDLRFYVQLGHVLYPINLLLRFLLLLSFMYTILRPFGGYPILSLLAGSAVLLAILTVALSHTFDIHRYFVSMFPLVLVFCWVCFDHALHRSGLKQQAN